MRHHTTECCTARPVPPRDPQRRARGSQGGAGAAVVAGAAPIADATAAGSIRVPAVCNGLFTGQGRGGPWRMSRQLLSAGGSFVLCDLLFVTHDRVGSVVRRNPPPWGRPHVRNSPRR
ncbi:amidase family protein [Streptomyces sp. NPDC102462]|uniref:amidase family protein n=1 Tax=Streptomyces sp. NPDC102462 TaxID=3366178 RepID=UPI003807ABE2